MGRRQAFERTVFAERVGYVQHIDVAAIQARADAADAQLWVAALPGTFAAPGRALACVHVGDSEQDDDVCARVVEAFQIGNERLFDDDPSFRLVVLAEIADRALSPAVNDPGTAIGVIGTLLRLFVLWSEPSTADDEPSKYERVEVPEIALRDMLDDAFTAIGRDGAGVVEVAVRLQKALASIDDAELQEAARYHARLALKRAGLALEIEEDLAVTWEAGLLRD